jgi:hypothetical protein
MGTASVPEPSQLYTQVIIHYEGYRPLCRTGKFQLSMNMTADLYLKGTAVSGSSYRVGCHNGNTIFGRSWVRIWARMPTIHLLPNRCQFIIPSVIPPFDATSWDTNSVLCRFVSRLKYALRRQDGRARSGFSWLWNMNHCWVLMKGVWTFVFSRDGNFLTSWTTISFSQMTVVTQYVRKITCLVYTSVTQHISLFTMQAFVLLASTDFSNPAYYRTMHQGLRF